jgi:hypothetical protein
VCVSGCIKLSYISVVLMHVIGLLSVPNDALDSSCLSLSYLLACSPQDTTGIGFLVLKKVDFYSDQTQRLST